MLASIILELYPSGIHLICEETEEDDFIEYGNVNKLIEHINSAYIVLSPDSVFTLTEKGKNLYDEDMV